MKIIIPTQKAPSKQYVIVKAENIPKLKEHDYLTQECPKHISIKISDAQGQNSKCFQEEEIKITHTKRPEQECLWTS